MDERGSAYRVCLLLTRLNLLGILVMLLASTRMSAVVSKLSPEESASFVAVIAVEFFLLLAIFATAVSITLYVKRGERNESSAPERTDVEAAYPDNVVEIRRAR